MSKADNYRDFLLSVRSSLGYWKSYSLLQFTSSLTRIMRADRVSGRKLASLLGISAAQVSKVLRGNENVTIETMAKFAAALDATVHIHVAKRGVPVRWVEDQPNRSVAISTTRARVRTIPPGEVAPEMAGFYSPVNTYQTEVVHG